MLSDPTEFATFGAHRDFGHAVPTPDHFIPALYLASVAGSRQPEILVDGCAYGSLSMTSYTLGRAGLNAAGAGGSPHPPTDLPPDGSNI
jgi:4,5-DOPA dioxygenase extradiol